MLGVHIYRVLLEKNIYIEEEHFVLETMVLKNFNENGEITIKKNWPLQKILEIYAIENYMVDIQGENKDILFKILY